MSQQLRSRQARALTRLEAQLKSGVKSAKDGNFYIKEDYITSLTDGDTKRINKEINILKQRL
jgi:hypothetical protein|tara:strand:+ start:697 stop:882 length:186 start_codon:yes stop_codon:yes gene_type:complete